MDNKARISALLFLAVSLAASARPRGDKQMLRLAAEALFPAAQTSPGATSRVAAAAPKTLVRMKGLAVYTSADGRLAVVSSDDAAPAVLGLGTKADSDNPHFKWWLELADEAVQEAGAAGRAVEVTRPDPTKYKASVEPLTHTEWGQQTPFNDLCPIARDDSRCLTGCVATSIAQVLYSHKGPAHGYGRRTIYYPQYDVTGTAVYVDFGNEVFDWQNMLASYKGTYTGRQATAVATLMRDLGVAVNMNYGEGASGAYHTDAAEGLKSYLGIESARRVARSAYTETEWMNMLYAQLSDGLPVVYGGSDYSYGGHSFVVDGYDSDGRMHINWGWNGDDNGYYYLFSLSPSSRHYTFSQGQDAIIDIRADGSSERYSARVTLTEAGTLSAHIGEDRKYNYDSLAVAGPINGDDIRLIREMAGRDSLGAATDGRLRVLDLTEARIVSGGGAYLIDGSRRLVTAAASFTERMFYGCSFVDVTCPGSLLHFGDGALAMCNRLDSVRIAPAEDADFTVQQNVVYNSKGNEVIAVLPSVKNRVTLAKGIHTLHDYCFSGCNHVKHVVMASTVQTIGREAFNDCIGLVDLKTYSKTVPELTGPDVFKGIGEGSVRLYVPRGTGSAYVQAPQWQVFGAQDGGSVVEFGTTIKARNATREVGEENPRFSYQTIGDYVDGTAELVCEATKESPAGKYAIHVLPGTISDEGVEYVDGWLFVTASTGIDAVAADRTFDVYNMQGVCVRRHTTTTDGLAPGIYVVDGKKRKVLHGIAAK